jgi:hypothetical protein
MNRGIVIIRVGFTSKSAKRTEIAIRAYKNDRKEFFFSERDLIKNLAGLSTNTLANYAKSFSY